MYRYVIFTLFCLVKFHQNMLNYHQFYWRSLNLRKFKAQKHSNAFDFFMYLPMHQLTSCSKKNVNFIVLNDYDQFFKKVLKVNTMNSIQWIELSILRLIRPILESIQKHYCINLIVHWAVGPIIFRSPQWSTHNVYYIVRFQFVMKFVTIAIGTYLYHCPIDTYMNGHKFQSQSNNAKPFCGTYDCPKEFILNYSV